MNAMTDCSNIRKRTTEELIAEAEARLPEWAVARAHGDLVEGAQLPTRDGRRMGNAHIIRIVPAPPAAPSLNYLILTDAGNTVVFSEGELREQFYPPEYIGTVSEIIEKFWRQPVPLLEPGDRWDQAGTGLNG